MTWTGAFRPEKLTIYVRFYVESEFQVENTRFFASRPRKLGKTTLIKISKILICFGFPWFSVVFLVFFNRIIGLPIVIKDFPKEFFQNSNFWIFFLGSFFLIFEVWMQKTSIFNLKFGFYVKIHIYGQIFRSKSFSPGQNLI